MKFYMPVKVYDEQECVALHGEELASLGRKALIVTGKKSAQRSGALNDVCTVLMMYGTPWYVFSGVEENPSVETVRKAASAGLAEGCDFVIGIGGGSPMDAAKAAAFLMKQEDPQTADLYDASMSSEAVPVAAVPTTCGTGSEVTGVSVLTLHEKRTKKSIPHKIFPTIALIDGKYLNGAHQTMITNTSVDALAHMMESYLSKKADAYSKAIAIEGLKIWSPCKEVLDGTRKADDADFSVLMRASTFAGMAIAQTGTSIPHALSYIVTYEDRIVHGKACGLFLARFVKEAAPEDRDPILEAAGFSDIDAFVTWIDKVFADTDVSPETLQRAYSTVVKDEVRMNGSRVPMDADALKRVVGIQ
ncbi:MAG: iron-containing alcohol dehydrogenase [Solobacterium sp.]|nr:iron-containing alcohol dehydrogenase [Solobacterium sp.]